MSCQGRPTVRGLIDIFRRQTVRTLRWFCLPFLAVSVIVAMPGISVWAAPPRTAATQKAETATTVAAADDDVIARKPTPLEDDAALHDVHFVSSKFGWAVGDHGVIWRTADGGDEWTIQNSGVSCSLNSVCFLTDRVGWAAGGGMMPYTHLSYGVVLKTTDGGRTWQTLVAPPDLKKATPTKVEQVPEAGDETTGAQQEKDVPQARPAARPNGLPRLTRIKFFSPDEGIAVGEGTDDRPAGVYFTEDGGLSWQERTGQASPGWLAADFVNPDVGVVAGPRGQMALVQGEQLAAPRMGKLGLRALRDVVLDSKLSGWMVGDGGLVLRSTNSGIVWQAPPAPLPDGIREACDFHAVFCRGNRVWIAGSPGSVVWHSPDAGKTWEKQLTGQSAPLQGIHFSTEKRGCAVGEFGTILVTENGGRAWHAVRGAGRRLALMMLTGTSRDISLKPIVELSGDLGYRSLIAAVSSDAAPQIPGETDPGVRLAEAALRAGGSGAFVDWHLPLAIPGLERDEAKLIAEWNRRTEGKLEDVLIGGIVRLLRTWRPNVLVLEQPGAADAMTRFVNDAALKAIGQANDSTRFLEHRDLAGLEPWQVDKLYLHLPAGSTGHVHIEPHQFLPRLGQTVRMAAGDAEGLLFDRPATTVARDAFRLVRMQWNERQETTFVNSFFTGLPIPPGSEARRQLLPVDEAELERRTKIARRQRTFSAHTERAVKDPVKAGQLVAQLAETVQGMPAPQAALQLSELVERYQQNGHWELAELTLVEIAEKYPGEPAGVRAMQQLIQSWASAEVTWRRLRNDSAHQSMQSTDPSQAETAILQVEARLEQQERAQNRTIFDGEFDEQPTPVDRRPGEVSKSSQTVHKNLAEQFRFWQARALRMSRLLEQREPRLATAPAVQFPMAALYRQRGFHDRADEIYRRFVQQGETGAWSLPAEFEFWLTRPLAPPRSAMYECARVAERPILGGGLSDPCWQRANELHLKGIDTDGDPDRLPLVMLCCDEEYLYLGASLPYVEGTRRDRPSDEARQYDEEVIDFDRLTFYLDTDRDRMTCFALTIDQRGKTNDSCANDRTWNPRWIVVVEADSTHWRIEAAIPFDELGPFTPGAGAAWGLGVVRTVPAVGWQTWTEPAGDKPRPETFGYLKFD